MPESKRQSTRSPPDAALPGGDFPPEEFEFQLELARERWKFLDPAQAQRLVSAYGSRVDAVLGDASERADLGEAFGPELTAAEVRYLMTREWARFPDDILWRRSKLGLTLGMADRERLEGFMARSA